MAEAIKIVTLNLRHNADHWEARFPLVVDLLRDEMPDIIALQEVFFPVDQAGFIKRALTLPYRIHTASKTGEHPVEGIALLSRLPVHNHEIIALPGADRIAQRLHIEKNGRNFYVANTHLHHRPIDSETIRLPQMQTILEWMTGTDTPFVLCGDFNALPESSTTQAAKARLDSVYEQVHGHEPDRTFPSPMRQDAYPGVAITLDYIFYTPESMRATAARVIGDQPARHDPTLYPSDHYGLSTTLLLD